VFSYPRLLDDRIDGVGLEHRGDAERRELDDRDTPRADCVTRIESRRASVVEFGAPGVLYPRDEGRLFERDVSALLPLGST
jgi:hypothetical protein